MFHVKGKRTILHSSHANVCHSSHCFLLESSSLVKATMTGASIKNVKNHSFDVKNHTAATPLDGRYPNILGKYEIGVEQSINSSDLVWVFQLCGEKNPLVLNNSDLSYFLETDVSTADTR